MDLESQKVLKDVKDLILDVMVDIYNNTQNTDKTNHKVDFKNKILEVFANCLDRQSYEQKLDDLFKLFNDSPKNGQLEKKNIVKFGFSNYCSLVESTLSSIFTTVFLLSLFSSATYIVFPIVILIVTANVIQGLYNLVKQLSKVDQEESMFFLQDKIVESFARIEVELLQEDVTSTELKHSNNTNSNYTSKLEKIKEQAKSLPIVSQYPHQNYTKFIADNKKTDNILTTQL